MYLSDYVNCDLGQFNCPYSASKVPVIFVDSATVPESNWSLPPLVKRMKRGVIHMWIAMFQLDSPHTFTLTGECDETSHELKVVKLRVHSVNDVLLKSKNTYSQQALVNLRSKWTDRIKRKWLEIAPHQSTQSIVRELKEMVNTLPMLLKQYNPAYITHWPVIAQPKLNGFRCMAYLSDDTVELRTRSNAKYYYLNGIRSALLPILRALPSGAVIDGELYAHGLPRNLISSQLRMSTNTAVQRTLPDNENAISYCMFDLNIDQAQYERTMTLVRLFNQYATGNLVMVNSWLCHSYEEVYDLYYAMVQDGYEGLVVRCLKDKKGMPCKYKPDSRPNTAMKLKFWSEEEVRIIDVCESESGSHREKDSAMLVVDYHGNSIKIRAGSYEDRKRWLANPSEIVGRIITMRYETVNEETGLPQQPTMVAFRDFAE